MRLSIITINYNNAQGLQRTFASVIEQSFTDFEYIIIDGGSTDDSVSVIKKYGKHISYWVSEKDNGVYHAMNKGIAKSTGDYLLMLNSGDCLLNAEILMSVFGKNNYTEDILYGNVDWQKDSYHHTKSIFPSVLTFQFFWTKSLGHQATFIKKSLHDEAGMYDESLRVCSDWKFFVLSICKYSATYRHINDTIATCDCTGLSWNSGNFVLMDTERHQVLQEQFPLFYSDYKELERYKNEESRNRFKELKKNIKEHIKQVIRYKKGVYE